MHNAHRDTNLQAKLAEKEFVQNNTMRKRLGFTPHQMILGLSSGLPGVYDIPEGMMTLTSQQPLSISDLYS